MRIKEIHYDEGFEAEFRVLEKVIQKKAVKAEGLFRQNPFHPSLRLHKLEGRLKELWSISLDKKNRIIFKVMDDGVILFVSVGGHAIYERQQ